MSMTIKVTSKQFEELRDEFWEIVLSAPEDQRAQARKDAWDKLSQYEIALPEPVKHDDPEIVRLVERFCVDLRYKNDDCIIYDGSARDEDDLYQAVKQIGGFNYQGDWSDGYRSVYTSDKYQVIASYCEGDISITVHATKEDYDREIAEAEEFYATY
jgi:hypothetical protein